MILYPFYANYMSLTVYLFYKRVPFMCCKLSHYDNFNYNIGKHPLRVSYFDGFIDVSI